MEWRFAKQRPHIFEDACGNLKAAFPIRAAGREEMPVKEGQCAQKMALLVGNLQRRSQEDEDQAGRRRNHSKKKVGRPGQPELRHTKDASPRLSPSPSVRGFPRRFPRPPSARSTARCLGECDRRSLSFRKLLAAPKQKSTSRTQLNLCIAGIGGAGS